MLIKLKRSDASISAPIVCVCAVNELAITILWNVRTAQCHRCRRHHASYNLHGIWKKKTRRTQHDKQLLHYRFLLNNVYYSIEEVNHWHQRTDGGSVQHTYISEQMILHNVFFEVRHGFSHTYLYIDKHYCAGQKKERAGKLSISIYISIWCKRKTKRKNVHEKMLFSTLWFMH